MHEAVIAAGSIPALSRSDTQHDGNKPYHSLGRIERDRFVALDRFTVRNLELGGAAISRGNVAA